MEGKDTKFTHAGLDSNGKLIIRTYRRYVLNKLMIKWTNNIFDATALA